MGRTKGKGLAHTDDPVRHAVCPVVVHVLLLFIDGTDGIQTFCLPHSQAIPHGQLPVNRFQVTPEVGQLPANGFAGRFCGMLAASCVFQVIFAGPLTVGTGLFAVGRVMKNIKELFGILSGLVQQGHVLRIPDVGGGTGGIHDHVAAVAAASRMVVRIIVVVGLGLFFLTLFRIPNNYFPSDSCLQAA